MEDFSCKLQQSRLDTMTKNIDTVQKILNDVQRNGDSALIKYEKKFGNLKSVNGNLIKISKTEIKNAYSQITKEQLYSIKLLKKRLSNTELQVKRSLKDISIKLDDRTIISKKFTPLSSVGCYVPGGLARYPSSAIMSIVPAKIAGIKRIVVVSPSTKKQGTIDPLTVVASDICGATEIYRVGGVQAIGALAYGTRTIKPVDKIVGPGGAFVTTAKYLVSKKTAIDMLAGPTELGIICDDSSNPKFVVRDVMSQAEHSTDTLCYVMTTSTRYAKVLQDVFLEEYSNTGDRSRTINQSLSKNGFIAVCKNTDGLVKLADALAPEHLQIMSKDSSKIASRIKNAGLILVGPGTPSAASDYLLGSNHILPTNQFGKGRGSLSVLDFVKINTQVKSNIMALKDILKHMKPLTDAEGLSNHYLAVRSRLS